ncbi:MAG: transcriptional regulator [Nitrospirae bacterium]|nr:transcriptional regulator [Nitrospirota bacterium]
MPRNDQVIRQLYLLQQLEAARHGATLAQFLDALPPDLSRHPRTIRRDLAALEAANFPIVTERVNGQVRWRLMEGFRNIPALPLSPTELMALAFSRHLLTPLEGTEIQTALDSALSKASASIPPPAMEFVQQLQNSFSVGLGPHKHYRQHRAAIDTLTRAIAQKRTVQMRYYSASRNVTSRREVDPYRLRYVDGALYLIGYCHWRKDVRMFAVERIRSLTLTDHPYQMPLHFDVNAYVEDALVVMRGKRIDVELLFEKPTAAWVKDRVWHPSQKLAPLKGGRLQMRLTVADTRELVGWVLSFGAGVRVIRPETLQATVEEEAEKILRKGKEISE